jgi:hypothetical protein
MVHILGVRRRTGTDMVRGELALISMEGKRMCQQLAYFYRLQRMPDGVPARGVFVERMTTTTRDIEQSSRRSGRARIRGLCTIVYATLTKLRLLHYFTTSTKMSKMKWTEIVHGAVLEYEQEAWQSSMEKRSGDDGMWYSGVKKEWGAEKYLGMSSGTTTRTVLSSSFRAHYSRKLRAQMRTGSAPLQAIIHRIHSSVSPLCPHCPLGAVEDQAHAMCVCPLHDDARRVLYAVVEKEWQRGEEKNEEWWLHEAKWGGAGGGVWAEKDATQRAQWLLS